MNQPRKTLEPIIKYGFNNQKFFYQYGNGKQYELDEERPETHVLQLNKAIQASKQAFRLRKV